MRMLARPLINDGVIYPSRQSVFPMNFKSCHARVLNWENIHPVELVWVKFSMFRQIEQRIRKKKVVGAPVELALNNTD